MVQVKPFIPTGFKLDKKFREKFCLSPGKFERSSDLNLRFAYIFYTFSLLPELKIRRSLFIYKCRETISWGLIGVNTQLSKKLIGGTVIFLPAHPAFFYS